MKPNDGTASEQPVTGDQSHGCVHDTSTQLQYLNSNVGMVRPIRPVLQSHTSLLTSGNDSYTSIGSNPPGPRRAFFSSSSASRIASCTFSADLLRIRSLNERNSSSKDFLYSASAT